MGGRENLELEREKVTLLAKSIIEFVDFINDSYQAKYSNISNREKLLRLKLIAEEFHFKLIANEILRLNQVDLEQQQTRQLLCRFKSALEHVVEYVENNENDLFIFSGRIYILQNYCRLLKNAELTEMLGAE